MKAIVGLALILGFTGCAPKYECLTQKAPKGDSLITICVPSDEAPDAR